MRSIMISAAAIGLMSTLASATVSEVESNNTIATAQNLGPLSGTQAVLGTLRPADVDFYCVQLAAGDLFSAAIFDFTPTQADNDSMLGLFDSVGNLLAFDDDGGPDFLSILFLEIEESGTYYVGVTGFPDFNFAGGHGEDFLYKLVLNSSPIPGPATLASLAGIVAFSRRRRAN